MNANERADFVEVVCALAATCRQEASEAMLTGYWMGLEDLPLAAVRRAAVRAMRERKFMPTVAELRELCGEITPADRAAIAWQAVVDANRRHGYGASVNFDDPAINATVRNLGGWEAFTERVETEETWARKDFERVYQVYARRGVTADEGAALPGFHARNNAFHGHHGHVPHPVAIHTTLKPTPLLTTAPVRRAPAIGADAVALLEHVGHPAEGRESR